MMMMKDDDNDQQQEEDENAKYKSFYRFVRGEKGQENVKMLLYHTSHFQVCDISSVFTEERGVSRDQMSLQTHKQRCGSNCCFESGDDTFPGSCSFFFKLFNLKSLGDQSVLVVC